MWILYMLRNTFACVFVVCIAGPVWGIIALFSIKSLGKVLEKTGKLLQKEEFKIVPNATETN